MQLDKKFASQKKMLKTPSEEQEKIIVETPTTHMRILACAGSGKTTTMIHRILFMLSKGCLLKDFFIVTFTKNAANDIYERLTSQLSTKDGEDISSIKKKLKCGTFHSLAQKILKRVQRDNEDVDDDHEKGMLLKKSLCYSGDNETDVDNDDQSFSPCHVDESQYHFLHFLKSSHFEAIKLKNSIKYIFVDEFQDVNDVQYEIIKHLAGSARNDNDAGSAQNDNDAGSARNDAGSARNDNESMDESKDEKEEEEEEKDEKEELSKGAFVTVIGDDNQNIYSFRGSNVEYILNFPNDFPGTKTFYLSTNYRSTEPIVHLSNLVGRAAPPLKPPCFESSLRARGPPHPPLSSLGARGPPHPPLSSSFSSSSFHRPPSVAFKGNGERKGGVGEALAAPSCKGGVGEALAAPSCKGGVGEALAAPSCKGGVGEALAAPSCKGGVGEAIAAPSCKGGVGEALAAPAAAPTLWNTKCGFEGIKLICDEIHDLITCSDSKRKKVSPDEICILSRNSALLRVAEENLTKKNIRTKFFSGENSNISVVPSANITSNSSTAASVILSTIHSAKGLEWDHVYIIGMHQKYFPDFRETDVEKERRLFYVAVTRAKKCLTLSNSSTDPSLFVSELADHKNIFNLRGAPLKLLSSIQVEKYNNDNKSMTVENCIRGLNGLHYIQLKNKILPRNLLSEKEINNSDSSKFDIDSLDPIIRAEFGQFLYVLARRMIAEIVVAGSAKGSNAGSAKGSSSNDGSAKGNIEELIKNENAERCVCKYGDKQRSVPRNYATLLSSAYEEYKFVPLSSDGCNTSTSSDGCNTSTSSDGCNMIKSSDDHSTSTSSNTSTSGDSGRRQWQWKRMLDKIYLVSLCSSIVKGSKAILLMPINKKDLAKFSPLYDAIFSRLQLLINNSTQVQVEVDVKETFNKQEKEETKKSVTLNGKINLLINEKVAINFRYSSSKTISGESCNLEDILEIITCASLWNLNRQKEEDEESQFSIKEKRIETVGIYNLVNDSLSLFSLNGWKNNYKLGNFLVNCTF